MESLQNIQTGVQDKLNIILQNPYVMAILKVGLILYASRIAPKLPSYVQNTFENTFVKIIAIALLAYISEVDFQLAILLAIVLVLSANFLGGRGIFESYDNIGFNSVGEYQGDMTKYTNLLGKPAQISNFKLTESLSDNYPGCNNVTLADLLALFNGDAPKLQTTVQYAFYELNKILAGKDKENLTTVARAAGLPYNVELNDANAPLIATILLNYGYNISNTCQPPK
jgi:hypothetical protein